jgi:hypothetical protein
MFTEDFEAMGPAPAMAAGEYVIWKGKPKKSAYIADKALSMLPIAIFWLIFDLNFLRMAGGNGFLQDPQANISWDHMYTPSFWNMYILAQLITDCNASFSFCRVWRNFPENTCFFLRFGVKSIPHSIRPGGFFLEHFSL